MNPFKRNITVVSLAVLVLVLSVFIGRQLSVLSLPQGSLARLFPMGFNGEHVATLEVEIPQSDSFILRGTVPIPDRKYNFVNGAVPFSVLNPDGRPVQTQIEPVAYYANGTPSVVEVLARVDKPRDAQYGTRVQYKIAEDEHRQPEFRGQIIDVSNVIRGSDINLPERIKNMALNERLVIRTEDVFGHKYTLDLFRPKNAIEVTKYGTEAVQIMTYGTLLPLPGAPKGAPNGALNHHVGVHAYITLLKDEPVVGLDLIISNASVNGDPNDPDDDAMADLYFKNIELVIEGEDFVLEADPKDPFFGNKYIEDGKSVYPFIKDNPDGKMHVMKSRGAHTIRYFTIAPSSNVADAQRIVSDQGLGFAMNGRSSTNESVALYSWQNPETANYLTQGATMPNMDFALQSCRQHFSSTYQQYYNLFRSGQSNGYPVNDPRMGWAHPYGDRSADEVGGTDIYTYDGVGTLGCRSLDGYRYSKLINLMSNDRQRNFLYTKDGKAINHNDWLQNGPNGKWQPIIFYNTIFGGEDILGFSSAPTYQVAFVANNNLGPSYEDTLNNYASIDTAHYTRFTRRPQSLAWLGNDAVAKNVVNMAGMLNRLSLTEYSCESGSNCWNGLSLEGRLETQQNEGFYADVVSRDMGWGITATVAAYALSDDREMRRDIFDWLEKVSDLYEGQQYPQSCNNFMVHGKSTDDNEQRILHRGDVASTVYNSIQSMHNTVYKGQSGREEERVGDYLRKALYSIVNTMAWNEERGGPFWALPLGCWYTDTGNDGNPNNDINCPPTPEDIWCSWNEIPEDQQTWNEGVDYHHTLPIFAWGYNLTRDELFLSKAFELYGSWSDEPTLEKRIQKAVTPGPHNGSWIYLESAAPILSIAQRLGI